MANTVENADSLRAQVRALEEQLESLRARLRNVEKQPLGDGVSGQARNGHSATGHPGSVAGVAGSHDTTTPDSRNWPLSAEEYKRYGRQMIMPDIGLDGKVP